MVTEVAGRLHVTRIVGWADSPACSPTGRAVA